MNWCPGLGTVLANEEVTADGRSERGNFPVYQRPLKQWMLRITAYADRLLADLDVLDWSESIKHDAAQLDRPHRTGAHVALPGRAVTTDVDIEVFTTRPDTLFGATYMVLAPEHPLVDEIVANEWPGDDVVDDWESNPLDDWKGMFGLDRHAGRGGARATASSRPRSRELERQAEGTREDRRVHRRVRDQPHERRARSRSSSPTTC